MVTHIKEGTQLSVPRKIFEPKGNEVTGGWRKLHNEELHILYSSSDIIRIINHGG
jgi:hypothetical protein